ncbi:MAG: peptide ABC transporter substrate-binding protein, partial [Patescibacteria group bacterium]|nr:peptide ABC transporter substrate-binding protein [Patescibacteria group bacterium]
YHSLSLISVNDQPLSSSGREFRLKGGEKLLDIFRSFSATEKIVFLFFTTIALVTALILAYTATQYFLITVPRNGGTLTEGEIGVPRTINPVLASTDTDKDLTKLIYSGLLRQNISGKLVPNLAESYSVSSDGLVYDFILKKNLHFDDGTPITTDDVIFTISKIQDLAIKSPERAAWSDVTVKKVSQTELQFILKQPYQTFLQNTTLGIIPEHIWKNVNDDQFAFSSYNVQPVGDGPYKVSGIVKDANGIPQSYTLVPNDHAIIEPHIAKIILQFYPDESRAFEAFTAGEIDSLSSVNPQDAATLASSSKATRVFVSPVPRMFGVFFNQNQNPIFTDKAVRQALSLSVNRQDIIDRVISGYGNPIDSPVITDTQTSQKLTGSTTNSFDKNVALATSTLEKDGWKLGSDGIYAKTISKKTQRLSFTITTADTPDLKTTAHLLASEWQSIGVSVTVNVLEYGDLENTIDSRQYDSLLFGEYVGNGLDLYAFWHSSQRNAPGLNIAGYVNSTADRELTSIRTATNSTDLKAALAAFDSTFKSDVPAIFIYEPDFIYVMDDKVQNVSIMSVSSPADRFNGIADWYIETDRIWPIFQNL